MHITIQFDTDNAAFEDDFVSEARNIGEAVTERLIKALAIIAAKKSVGLPGLNSASSRHVLRDSNGNLIGWIVTEASN